MKASTAQAIAEEVCRARHKFPSSRHRLAALMEEVGELAAAFLDGEPEERIQAEAIQVAATAVRIIEEGDLDFKEGGK